MSWGKRTDSEWYQKWYKTARWRKRRREQLDKQPLCAYCLETGKHTNATVADHIQPHKGNRKLFWDRDNLQSLCDECHRTHKFREERTGKKIGCDASGVPLDKSSHWFS